MDEKINTRIKTRKQRRKEERKLKKLQKDCFKRHKPIPTMESLEKEKAKRKELQMMKRMKMKEKMQRKQERREREREEKEAEEENERQLKIINAQDMKTIRELEKKLKIKSHLNTLPVAFQRDALDYILNYKEEAEFEKSLVESGKQKKTKSKKTVELIENDSLLKDDHLDTDDSDNDNSDDEDMEMDYGDSNDEEEEEEDYESDDNKDDEEEANSEVDEEEEEEDEEEEEKEEEDDDDDDISDDSDERQNKVKVEKRKQGKKAVSEVKGILKVSGHHTQEKSVSFGDRDESKKRGNAVTEDIYGRLRDKEGNIVQESGAFVPPGKRLQRQSNESGSLDSVRAQISRIINRLHEKQMQMFVSQMLNLFHTHSRADISEALSSELLKDSIRNEAVKHNRTMDIMLLVAVLHSKVGNEVSGVFLESLVAKFDEIFQTIENVDGTETENQIENATLLLSHLYEFKVIDSHLIFCILEKLVHRFYVKDVSLMILIWKEIGFGLHKDDPKSFKNIYIRTTEKASTVDKAYAHMRVLTQQLSDVLAAVKNNNPRKLQKDDQEELENRKKLLKTILSDSVKAPLHVSLDDLLNAERKGKWWLVGSAWTGNSDDVSKTNVKEMPESEPHVDGINLKKLAQKLHMNTDVRKKILYAVVTADNYRVAFENVMKLNLPRRQDREIIHVVSVLCKRGKGNPFYTHLAEVFRKHNKRFQKMPGDSNNPSQEEDMDFD